VITSRRFVILEHDHPFLHWDLLLENGDSAATWRLLTRPAIHQDIDSERLADHRLVYLDFEGSISGDRGSVHRIQSGIWDGEITDTVFTLKLTGCTLSPLATFRSQNSDTGTWTFHD
jgi:DNA polymerase Ligase (LigD)